MTCRFSTKLPAQYRVPASQIVSETHFDLARFGYLLISSDDAVELYRS